ncbi:MAG: sulfurtransferase TusA family protein [Aigarchaeota archaeon]|nr:sulfurtransferase TusA family protein [Candidatus Pelearchaeum maunauluense]
MQTQKQKIIFIEGDEGLVDVGPTDELDVSGLVCPYPGFEAVKKIENAPQGAVVDITTDMENVARESIPVLMRNRGFRFAVFRCPDSDRWVVRVQKS